MRFARRKRRSAPAPPAGDVPLEVATAETGYGALVTIAGELDLATVPRVRAAFRAPELDHAGAVVVDLTGVTFMDSTGLAAVLELANDLEARRRRLVIVCPEGAARLRLDVTGVAEQLELHATREQAEAAAAAHGH